MTTTLIGTASLGVVLILAAIFNQPQVAAMETAEKAAEKATESAHGFFDTNVCVFGWSKNSCNGSLVGDVRSYACQRIVKEELVQCRTRHVSGILRFPIRQSNGVCGDDSGGVTRCDRTPQLDGTIVIDGDFVFGHGQCPFRGAWRGVWRLIDSQNVVVATGTGSGTLGTGSHRRPPCISSTLFPIRCSIDCERCYDVSTTESDTGDLVWHVALEGALQGEVFAGEWASSWINIALSGTLNTFGNANTPFDFGDWVYCGASDGTVLARCTQVVSPDPIE